MFIGQETNRQATMFGDEFGRTPANSTFLQKADQAITIKPKLGGIGWFQGRNGVAFVPL